MGRANGLRWTGFQGLSALRPEVVRGVFSSDFPCPEHGALWRTPWPRGLRRLKRSAAVSCNSRCDLDTDGVGRDYLKPGRGLDFSPDAAMIAREFWRAQGVIYRDGQDGQDFWIGLLVDSGASGNDGGQRRPAGFPAGRSGQRQPQPGHRVMERAGQEPADGRAGDDRFYGPRDNVGQGRQDG